MNSLTLIRKNYFYFFDFSHTHNFKLNLSFKVIVSLKMGQPNNREPPKWQKYLCSSYCGGNITYYMSIDV